jgi:hypothetical protein
VTLPTIALDFMPGAGPFDIADESYLNLTGATDSRASTPDHASFAVTDLDVRILLEIDEWPPVNNAYEVVGQYTISGSQKAWLFHIMADRKLRLRWSTNGSGDVLATSTATFDLPEVGPLALRVTLDVNNGAAGKTVRFYTSDSLTGTWSQVGTDVTTAGTTSIHNSTGVLVVGDNASSSFVPLAGRVYAIDWRAGIDSATAIANPNFATQSPGTTSFADAAGRTWTVTSPATIEGSDWEAIPDTADGRCRAMSLTYEVGRTSELDKFPPARLSATLRNHDRVLDPEYTSGPYYGQLLPRVPVRLQLDVGSGMVDQFYGFIETGWRQSYQKPYSVRCDIDLVDLLGVLEAEPLPGTAYDIEVLADSPLAFWRLDEDAGSQMTDSSGNGNNGFRDNGEPVDPLVAGGVRAFSAAHLGDNRGRYVGGVLPTAPPLTFEAWVKVPRASDETKMLLVVQRDGSLGPGLFIEIASDVNGSPNGELVVDFAQLGGSYKVRGHTRIDDNQIHHVVVTIADLTAAGVVLYVDGEVQTKTVISGTTPGNWTSHYWWSIANTWDNTYGDWGLGGVIDEVAIYDRVLDPDRIEQHYEAGTNAFASETTGARINRVLDIVGVPEAMRDIATGDTTVGPAEYGEGSAGAYLARVVESEQGVLYVNHREGGKLTFRGRYDRLTATRSTTSQATFTDDPDSGYHYRDDIAPEPNGIETVINTVDVSWQGGTETVIDEDSRSRYGSQSRSIATEAPTASAARSAGAWLTSRYGEPQSRIRHLSLGTGGRQTDLPALVTDLRISDRVTVQLHPNRIGDPIVNDLIIEGIRNEMSSDESWYTSASTSNADDIMVWIWGVSEWGVTTVWG